jgi:hypothetical protein
LGVLKALSWRFIAQSVSCVLTIFSKYVSNLYI